MSQTPAGHPVASKAGVAKASALPSTGENDSASALALGTALLMGAGLLGLKKRKKD
ncbi:LPXTG cell wall anchor domain-containing protein [Streptococcus loxodontisalivarius]|uniref:LPXTG cell wall anchor domain-containing protein n=1 Tax=Streptococcus loxodontisalivarius TaxID=1349415 RepID=UPI0023BAEDD8|nr:LPXTG cell wall anchor domain-containing protein [Streptococcus loxodontisalivarius]